MPKGNHFKLFTKCKIGCFPLVFKGEIEFNPQNLPNLLSQLSIDPAQTEEDFELKCIVY